MESFSERLRRFRRERKLTQQELADTLGVSNKTVSRWETEGGYPDVELLVPLARALGVTVDDLLDGDDPVRRISQTDWQNLLSYAFALGGGAMFFLLDLFMPTAICYLGYLGCMAYGAYLQRYYTYRSRWFFGANLIMNAAVNLALCTRTLALIFGLRSLVTISTPIVEHPETFFRGLQMNTLYATGATLLLTLALTAATGYFLRTWSTSEEPTAAARCLLRICGELESTRHNGAKLRLRMEKPGWQRVIPAVIPLLAYAYWSLSYFTPPLLEKIEAAKPRFALLLLALAALFTLPLLKRGLRRWIPLQWGMTALCWQMTGLLRYTYWLPRLQEYRDAWVGTASNNSVSIIGQASPAMAAMALCLAAIWIVSGYARLRWEDSVPKEETPG